MGNECTVCSNMFELFLNAHFRKPLQQSHETVCQSFYNVWPWFMGIPMTDFNCNIGKYSGTRKSTHHSILCMSSFIKWPNRFIDSKWPPLQIYSTCSRYSSVTACGMDALKGIPDLPLKKRRASMWHWMYCNISNHVVSYRSHSKVISHLTYLSMGFCFPTSDIDLQVRLDDGTCL